MLFQHTSSSSTPSSPFFSLFSLPTQHTPPQRKTFLCGKRRKRKMANVMTKSSSRGRKGKKPVQFLVSQTGKHKPQSSLFFTIFFTIFFFTPPLHLLLLSLTDGGWRALDAGAAGRAPKACACNPTTSNRPFARGTAAVQPKARRGRRNICLPAGNHRAYQREPLQGHTARETKATTTTTAAATTTTTTRTRRRRRSSSR